MDIAAVLKLNAFCVCVFLQLYQKLAVILTDWGKELASYLVSFQDSHFISKGQNSLKIQPKKSLRNALVSCDFRLDCRTRRTKSLSVG